jgi:cholesterol transport system auxiliary component
MRAPRLCTLLLCAASAASALGCALTSKSDPLAPRYFSPERSGDVLRTGARPPGPPAELRLGRIDGVSHLQERLVFRDSAYELGYYAERRWTEAPEQYLKRRLSRVLFEERGLRHVVSGPATTLAVQLTAFEEVRAPKRLVHVQVTVSLYDQRVVRWEETLTVDMPVAATTKGDVTDEVVKALGEALRAVVDQIADRVVGELAVPPDVTSDAAPASISGMSKPRRTP